MQYQVKVLTPVLVGDGDRLSPIDYMVWKDQVNVLDQKRIFKLLSRGPRFDGYLQQLLRSEKLDFASWGGFAQNYAGRRISFESPGVGQILEKTRAEYCHIPTFFGVADGALFTGNGAERRAAYGGAAPSVGGAAGEGFYGDARAVEQRAAAAASGGTAGRTVAGRRRRQPDARAGGGAIQRR